MDHSPNNTYSSRFVGMWSGHRFEDYKVLNLVEISFTHENVYSYHIYLYSLKTNSWKRIPCTGFYCGNSFDCVSRVFYCKRKIEQTHVILSFDFSSETLSILHQPKNSCDGYCLEYKALLGMVEWNGGME